MNEIFTVAFYRSVVHAVLLFGVTALTAWAMTDVPKEILAPAGAAALTIIITRGLGEGTVDTSRGDSPPPGGDR